MEFWVLIIHVLPETQYFHLPNTQLLYGMSCRWHTECVHVQGLVKLIWGPWRPPKNIWFFFYFFFLYTLLTVWTLHHATDNCLKRFHSSRLVQLWRDGWCRLCSPTRSRPTLCSPTHSSPALGSPTLTLSKVGLVAILRQAHNLTSFRLKPKLTFNGFSVLNVFVLARLSAERLGFRAKFFVFVSLGLVSFCSLYLTDYLCCVELFSLLKITTEQQRSVPWNPTIKSNATCLFRGKLRKKKESTTLIWTIAASFVFGAAGPYNVGPLGVGHLCCYPFFFSIFFLIFCSFHVGHLYIYIHLVFYWPLFLRLVWDGSLLSCLWRSSCWC